MDPALAAIIVAVIAGIPASVAAVVGLLNRSQMTSKDSNGRSMRDEVLSIERMLTEHIRQSEEALHVLGLSREQALAWMVKLHAETAAATPKSEAN